jgi:hypothetical protein
MKKLYAIVFFMAICSVATAQNSLVMGYQFSIPQNQMKEGWNQAHGANMAYLVGVGKGQKFSVGGQLGFGQYGRDKNEQHYSFRGASATIVTASVWSQFTNFGVIGRYQPIGEKRVTPFAEILAGYMLAQSRISIANPNVIGDDDCVAHERDQWALSSDGTIYGALGAGLQIALGKPSQKMKHGIEIQARSVFGGQIEYANMNRLYNHPDLTNPANSRGQSPNERPIIANFINVGTNEQHEHTVAELYKHPLQMWQFNINWVLKLGSCRQ